MLLMVKRSEILSKPYPPSLFHLIDDAVDVDAFGDSLHGENMVKPSPPSLFHLIDDAVDGEAFGDSLVGHSLLTT